MDDEDEPLCEECDDTGHRHGCDDDTPWDLGDLLAKCEGCCPNGCSEKGMGQEATVAKHRMRDLLSRYAK